MIWLFQSLFLIYVFYMVGDVEGSKPPRHFFQKRHNRVDKTDITEKT